jgi:hypothetical protein
VIECGSLGSSSLLPFLYCLDKIGLEQGTVALLTTQRVGYLCWKVGYFYLGIHIY